MSPTPCYTIFLHIYIRVKRQIGVCVLGCEYIGNLYGLVGWMQIWYAPRFTRSYLLGNVDSSRYLAQPRVPSKHFDRLKSVALSNSVLFAHSQLLRSRANYCRCSRFTEICEQCSQVLSAIMMTGLYHVSHQRHGQLNTPKLPSPYNPLRNTYSVITAHGDSLGSGINCPGKISRHVML